MGKIYISKDMKTILYELINSLLKLQILNLKNFPLERIFLFTEFYFPVSVNLEQEHAPAH